MVDLLDRFEQFGQISGGVVVFRDGTKFYSMFVGLREDGYISVRISKGEYVVYTREGKLTYKNGDSYCTYDSECAMDVISFSRCAWYDLESMGLAHDYYSAAHISKEADGKVLRAIQQ